jgi:hypothetical protein
MGTMAAPPRKPVSNEPDDFTSGGLINDIDVTIKSLRYTLDKPENYTFDDRVFLHMEMVSADGVEHDQFWAAGNNEDFVPSQDGGFLLPLKDRTTQSKSSNAFDLLNSFRVNGGLPKGKLNEPGGVGVLVGTNFHIIQVPAKHREGLAGSDTTKTGQTRTVAVCSKVNSYPWDKGAGKGKARTPAAAAGASSTPATSASAAPAATDNGGSDDEKVAAFVKAILEEAGSEGILHKTTDPRLTQTTLKVKVFKAISGKADKTFRDEATRIVQDENWLAANGFMVDGDRVYLIP